MVNQRIACALIAFQTLISLPAFSMSKEFEGFISKAPCAQQVQEATSQVLFNQNWFPLMISRPHKRLSRGISFRNTKTGYGYQLFSDATSTTLAEFKLDGTAVSSNVWDQKNGCLIKSSDYKSGKVQMTTSAQRQGKGFFSDKDLFETLKSNQWGVIFVWSPNMPLSLEAIQNLKAAMKETNGKLTILADGKTSIEAIEALVKTGQVQPSEIRQVSSSELYAHNMTLHYPIAFIYKNGLLSNRTYIGHKRTEMYKLWISTALAGME